MVPACKQFGFPSRKTRLLGTFGLADRTNGMPGTLNPRGVGWETVIATNSSAWLPYRGMGWNRTFRAELVSGHYSHNRLITQSTIFDTDYRHSAFHFLFFCISFAHFAVCTSTHRSPLVGRQGGGDSFGCCSSICLAFLFSGGCVTGVWSHSHGMLGEEVLTGVEGGVIRTGRLGTAVVAMVRVPGG